MSGGCISDGSRKGGPRNDGRYRTQSPKEANYGPPIAPEGFHWLHAAPGRWESSEVGDGRPDCVISQQRGSGPLVDGVVPPEWQVECRWASTPIVCPSLDAAAVAADHALWEWRASMATPPTRRRWLPRRARRGARWRTRPGP